MIKSKSGELTTTDQGALLGGPSVTDGSKADLALLGTINTTSQTGFRQSGEDLNYSYELLPGSPNSGLIGEVENPDLHYYCCHMPAWGAAFLFKAMPEMGLYLNTALQLLKRLGLKDNDCFHPKDAVDVVWLIAHCLAIFNLTVITTQSYSIKLYRMNGYPTAEKTPSTTCLKRAQLFAAGLEKGILKTASLLLAIQDLGVTSPWRYAVALSLCSTLIAETAILYNPSTEPASKAPACVELRTLYHAAIASLANYALYWVSFVGDPDHLEMTQNTFKFQSNFSIGYAIVATIMLLPNWIETFRANAFYIYQRWYSQRLTEDQYSRWVPVIARSDQEDAEQRCISLRRVHKLLLASSVGSQTIATVLSLACLLYTVCQIIGCSHVVSVVLVMPTLLLIPGNFEANAAKLFDALGIQLAPSTLFCGSSCLEDPENPSDESSVVHSLPV